MSFIEKKRCKIKLLSPLHIGAGKTIPYFYLLFLDKRCFVLDEEKFSEQLLRIGEIALDSFFQFSKKRRGNLKEFLTDLIGEDKLKEFAEKTKAYSLKVKAYPKRELHTFIRDPFYRPYIPGSSLKGAFRTAFIYLILKKMKPEIREELLIKHIKDKLGEIKSNPKRFQMGFLKNQEKSFFKSVEEDLTRFFRFYKTQKKFDMHSDILKAIKFSDTKPISADSSSIEEISVYTKGEETGIRIFVETIPEGTELEFEISINKALLNKVKAYNIRIKQDIEVSEIVELISDPIRTISEWSNDLLEYEIRAIKDIAGNPLIYMFQEKPNIQLGWGGGLLTKTICLFVPEKLRAEILAVFKSRSYYTPAPSSRRLTKQLRPLGWARIEEV